MEDMDKNGDGWEKGKKGRRKKRELDGKSGLCKGRIGEKKG